MRESDVGLQRSAALMHALGADAAAVWARLPEDKARRLSEAMGHWGADQALAEDAATAMLAAGTGAASGPTSQLAATNAVELARRLDGEPAHIIALALCRLPVETAAGLLGCLPVKLSVAALRQVLEARTPRPESFAVIDRVLKAHDDFGTPLPGGPNRLAQIFDELEDGAETSFLEAIEQTRPGASHEIRSLMFTFADLPTLSRAGLQTFLAKADRGLLTLALKGDETPVRAALLDNMTQRAQQALLEDIHALGPMRRSEVLEAQRKLARLVRALVKSGDILPPGANDTDEFVA